MGYLGYLSSQDGLSNTSFFKAVTFWIDFPKWNSITYFSPAEKVTLLIPARSRLEEPEGFCRFLPCNNGLNCGRPWLETISLVTPVIWFRCLERYTCYRCTCWMIPESLLFQVLLTTAGVIFMITKFGTCPISTSNIYRGAYKGIFVTPVYTNHWNMLK